MNNSTNSSFEEEILDSEFLETCDIHCLNKKFQFWIEGVAVPIISCLGILGNLICLVVLNNKNVDLKPSFSNLLKSLSVYDILILVNTNRVQTITMAMLTQSAGKASLGDNNIDVNH